VRSFNVNAHKRDIPVLRPRPKAMCSKSRMETAFTGYGQWYFDSRGWGDLIVDTAYEFPVPWQELAARQLPFYSLGGGGKSSATKGTYGF
jgi:hypothetical protein